MNDTPARAATVRIVGARPSVLTRTKLPGGLDGGLADAAAYVSKHAGRACAHGIAPIVGAAPLDPIIEPISSPEFLTQENGRRITLTKISA